MKFGKKFGWPPKFGGPKTSKFRRDFAQLRDLIANVFGVYETRHRHSENGVANYGHCRRAKLNSVYLGPQMAQNGAEVLTHPTGDINLGISTHLVCGYFHFS